MVAAKRYDVHHSRQYTLADGKFGSSERIFPQNLIELARIFWIDRKNIRYSRS